MEIRHYHYLGLLSEPITSETGWTIENELYKCDNFENILAIFIKYNNIILVSYSIY